MQIFSFIREGLGLEIVEVETSFLPGIPRIHLTGLPDQAVKESLLRVRSSIIAGDFSLPSRDQVIIHLRPGHVRKTSLGLDLALTISYLFRSGQLDELPIGQALHHEKKIFVYGELGLDGQIFLPDDFELLNLDLVPKDALLLIGCPTPPNMLSGRRVIALNHLTDLVKEDLDVLGGQSPTGESSGSSKPNASPEVSANDSGRMPRPDILNVQFSKPAALLMSIVALGEHSLFLVGPAGTGKTTFIESCHRVMRDPSDQQVRDIRRMAKVFGIDPQWRPMVAPHHSSTSLSIIGGGSPPVPGELTRAHCGVLYLDEFLEFESHVIEALREPAEKREITVSRVGSSRKFPADIQMLSSSNLCPCGDLVPGVRKPSCNFTATRCRSYMSRMSGPMLDRFEVLGITHLWPKDRPKTLAQIYSDVQRGVEFARKSRGEERPNSKVPMDKIKETYEPFVLNYLAQDQLVSERRQNATLRVARTMADLAGSEKVLAEHIRATKDLTFHPFREFRQMLN